MTTGVIYWVATVVYMICVFMPVNKIVVMGFLASTAVLFAQANELGATNLLLIYGAATISNLIVLLYWRQ